MLAGNQAVTWTHKYSLQSKWNMLFDKSPEWISFKPQPGLKVYPCYSCRNMFSSKLTFQDHINRRVIIIKYKCTDCSNVLTFYNRCSFLLHTRKHYSLQEGLVNLENVDISVLPVELAGFTYHENIPVLYDEEEEYVANNIYVNSQFYNPDENQAGRSVITLKPYNLVFQYKEGDKTTVLNLKQITSNIPLCQFMPVQETVLNAKHPVQSANAQQNGTFLIKTPIMINNTQKNSSTSNSSNSSPDSSPNLIIDTSQSNINNNNNNMNGRKKSVLKHQQQQPNASHLQRNFNTSLNLNETVNNNGDTSLTNGDSAAVLQQQEQQEEDFLNNFTMNLDGPTSELDIKQETVDSADPSDDHRSPPPDDFTLPIISKIESLSDQVQQSAASKKIPSCPECQSAQISMATHFVGTNKPMDESLCCFVCKYIAPTKCSLKAHIRTHGEAPPFICPECGTSFPNFKQLETHMDTVCFHQIKQLRYRCPALKCGKLFVVLNTFSQHFATHMQCLKQCSVCDACFLNDADFADHATQHNNSCKVVKVYACGVCKSSLSQDDYDQHVTQHVNDRQRCVYIYTCKNCRSYFRSTATYAVHKGKCCKTVKPPAQFVHCSCSYCGQKIIFKERDLFKMCPVCKQVCYHPSNYRNSWNVGPSVTDTRRSMCILCKEEVLDEDKPNHAKHCKYNNPVVTLPLQDMDVLLDKTNNDYDADSAMVAAPSSDSHSSNASGGGGSTGSDLEAATPSPQKQLLSESSVGSNSNQNSTGNNINNSNNNNGVRRRKRKRTSFGGASGHHQPSKKSTLNSSSPADVTVDLQADSPITFDGTYLCKPCGFTTQDRARFHAHVVQHRDVSTAYQCMECGECFVVKPSLMKHLLHFHKIRDTNSYMSDNECFDKGAIEELENQLNMLPGEHKGPLKENQCRICLKVCDSRMALDKHFRIHGMAFLMNKVK